MTLLVEQQSSSEVLGSSPVFLLDHEGRGGHTCRSRDACSGQPCSGVRGPRKTVMKDDFHFSMSK